MFPLSKGIFITGTDTGVGKTVVVAALGFTLRYLGKKVAPMKPVQTGTLSEGLMDIEFVQMVMDTDYPLEEVCPYRFPHPLAPSVAARLVEEEIDLEGIKSAFYKLASSHDTVIVEGAGGLLVPIRENYLMSDLAFDLEIPVIIVSRPGLGTLNHTLLTAQTAKAKGLKISGVVISGFPSEPSIAERTNPEMILSLAKVPILGILPFDPEVSVEEGRVGNLRNISSASFAPELGGSFRIEDFLRDLKV